MTDIGVFPPRTAYDIAAYDEDACIDGYREYRPDEPEPGPNHAPGYRWGWINRRRDMTGEEDGFEWMRYAYIQMTRRLH